MDISEIVTAFGAYYLRSGQNMNRILGMLTQGLATPQYCTPIKTDDTVFQLGRLTMNDIVQSFQKGWTPKNASAFIPNELRLYHMKMDEEITPDDVEETWLGFLANENVARADWPLIKFLIEHPEQGIIAAINRDMELKEYGHGEYVAPTTNVAATTGQSMNGLIKQINDGIAGGTMNSVPIGTLDKDTIFDQVELFVDGISEVYQSVAMNVFMSPAWAKYYHRDKRSQGFYAFPDESNISRLSGKIDFMPQQVVGLPSLTGSDVIFATPKSNLLHLTKKAANKTKIKVEEYRRTVSLLADWWEGLGFGMDAAVWSNVVASSGSASE